MQLSDTELRSVLATNVTTVMMKMQAAAQPGAPGYSFEQIREDLERAIDHINEHLPSELAEGKSE